MLITFFIVRNKPNVFRSKIQIATGIVDQSQRVSTQDLFEQDSKVQEQFTNLIETFKLNEVVDQVSFKLLLHDLSESSFKPKISKYLNLAPDVKNQIAFILNNKLDSFATLDLNIPDEKMIDSLLIKLKYDHESLLKNISIYRVENSDFIDLEADAENPQLSAFIANNLTDRFIAYYTKYVNSGHSRSNDFFAKLMADKKDTLNRKIAALEAFKVKNGILDIGDESKDAFSQISNLEMHQQQAEKDVIAYTGALASINARFNPKDRQYVEATTSKINAKILNTKDRLRVMNDKYIQSGFDPVYKQSVDSLQDVLSAQINESSDKIISNPMAAKNNIVEEKLKMENELELAKYSAGSLKSQVNALKAKMSGLLPAQAAVKSYERDIDVATKEYLDAQDKYNQANVSTITPVQLRQLQNAMPRRVQSTEKQLTVFLSGIVSFIIYFIILLVVFYLDNKVYSQEDLEKITGIHTIGFLSSLPTKIINEKDTKRLQKDKNRALVYLDLVRSIRFEIETALAGDKALAITSINPEEGKTLFSFSLAFAYALANKKVLLIDGNFDNSTITNTVKSKDFVEDYFKNKPLEVQENNKTATDRNNKKTNSLEIDATTKLGKAIQRLVQSKNELHKSGLITILGNRGNDASLLEISNIDVVRERMAEFKKRFDIIIIEAGSLNTLNKPKEWISIADKALAVFEINKTITEASQPAIHYLQKLDKKMMGWVVNKVDIDIPEPTQKNT